MIWLVLTASSAALWVHLIAFRGGYWRADQRLAAPAVGRQPRQWPQVTAVIPARDEAETIAQVIAAHMKTDYPGDFHVILVDDQSSDGTGSIARAAGAGARRPLEIVAAPPLAAGWTGKLWAVNTGLLQARALAPDTAFFLLTDADIVHAPGTLRRLVEKAQDEDCALVSLMARLDNRGVWGGLLIPAFVYFFQKLYPFPRANDPWSPVAAAAGGCMLVNRAALEAAGGVRAIRNALIDDCALAQIIKADGARRIWLGLAREEVVSLRDNRALSSVWNMVARTAFTQLDYSWGRLAGTTCGMALIYLVPPLAVLAWPFHANTPAGLLGVFAWAAMAFSYRPTARLYGEAPLKVFALPLAAALYTLMTISSALRHLRGRGGQWKGRTYEKGPPKPAGLQS